MAFHFVKVWSGTRFQGVLKNAVNLPEAPSFGDVSFPQGQSAYTPLYCPDQLNVGQQETALGIPVYTQFSFDNSECFETVFDKVDKPFWWESLNQIIIQKLWNNGVDRIQVRVIEIISSAGNATHVGFYTKLFFTDFLYARVLFFEQTKFGLI